MAALSLLAGQIDVPPMTTAAERDRHLDRVAAKIRARLERRHHDLVVLPELSSIDYSRASFDRLAVLAEPLDGPSFHTFGALARELGTAIVYGMPRRGAGACYISQIAVDARGERIGFYDKLHVAQFGASMEKDYFIRGDHLFVFRLAGVTIAPVICYDIRFPELTRILALDHGVQLVLHCGAYARDESFHTWHHFSVSRAMENQICLLSLNRAGESYGDSLFCPPWVDRNNPGVRFPQAAEAFETIEIDTALIEGVREAYPFLEDRLGDYSEIIAPG